MKNSLYIRKLVYTALCLALALVLPFLTGQIPEIGSMLCPMHIPVLLCGFLCGWQWGAIAGAAAPILRSAIFSAPPMYPVAVGMMFELAAYGLVSGLMHRIMPRRYLAIYASLVTAMLLGRIVYGAAQAVMLSMNSTAYTFSAFISGAVIQTIPGILIQLLLIPPIVAALQKAGLSLNSPKAYNQ